MSLEVLNTTLVGRKRKRDVSVGRSVPEGSQVDGDAILWLQGEDVDRRVPVIIGDGEAEAGEKHGQDDLSFHHGVGLPDAVARSGGERQEVASQSKGSTGEPLWVELMHILAPDCRVVVDRQHGDPNGQSLGNVKVPQPYILERHPR